MGKKIAVTVMLVMTMVSAMATAALAWERADPGINSMYRRP